MRKALIVGGGISGLSAAWALARRGIAVELFDQGPLPNPKASSYDEHRIIRHAYGTMEGYAALMPEAYRVWDSLWQATGRSHYEACGAVYFIRHHNGWYEGMAHSLDRMDIGYRDIPLSDVAARFPMIEEQGLLRVVETDGAGMLFPIRILTDLVVLLGRLGVTLHANTLVTAVDPDRGTLTSNGHVHAADTVIVAAGAWAERLVPSLHGVVVPSRQAVLYLSPPQALAEAWSHAPVMLDLAAEGGVYILPPRQGTRLKIGDHVFSREGDPDSDRVATDHDLERLWPTARAVLKGLDGYVELERKACFYMVHEHEEFQVRAAGAAGYVISACSGHGFKLGALMGELVARAIVGEIAAVDLADLAAGRVMAPVWERAA